jgi:hypothetical protein
MGTQTIRKSFDTPGCISISGSEGNDRGSGTGGINCKDNTLVPDVGTYFPGSEKGLPDTGKRGLEVEFPLAAILVCGFFLYSYLSSGGRRYFFLCFYVLFLAFHAIDGRRF